MSDAPIDIGPIELAEEQPEPAPRPRSKVRTVVLSSLLVVALGGAGVLGWTAWQISSQKDVKLTAPETVGTLTQNKSEDARSTADYLQTALAAEIDLDKTVAAVYSDPNGQDKNVLFFGGTTLLWTPEDDLDTAFNLIADNQGAVTGVHDVDAGELGGTAKCGTTKSDTGELPVCGWADHGSLALAMFPNRTVDEAAPMFRQLREASESR
ncbi:hypothetical protein GCM10010172_32680 [Paractinoplanes ferrugineus]|uniref:Uncharacterized protein n=1 Tax=Paractinoplanes ferrugineus TaxID=113564 RepID=A0A919J4R4_9ACTN|nr:hypothetical protein [Actinoplanes ferrugineus]GIE14801.1 hypothetical protein Afe05nite_66410 [Actinoplanes ferrugineus]